MKSIKSKFLGSKGLGTADVVIVKFRYLKKEGVGIAH
jgi:hypothetical protein